MKGLKGSRTAPANGGGCGGSGTFVPRLDLNAKRHSKFDNLMADTAHRKKMAKVTLPVITMPMASDE